MKFKQIQMSTYIDVTPSLLKVLILLSQFIYSHKKIPKHKVIWGNKDENELFNIDGVMYKDFCISKYYPNKKLNLIIEVATYV